QLTAATLNGRPVALRPSTERGHPVYDTYVDLPVGQEAVLALELVEPVQHEGHSANTQPLVTQQPLVNPAKTTVTTAHCDRRG
ncbi:MAG: hypothetical protein M3P91_02130, partial [Actinomycetota bacterium]|nr:hypothetical protein [Actinomycetota bacterium]